ncbi:hypothetical protein E2C01_014579 [Portunus trituberculatus]|uniref:Uncharacterized protein n=1 Tax=Portunus trituberculatus TaxID=210409 RepID=A0A5B7DJ76_PORTR|nr:hypothetical protein [Portunus trituberculatus]
MNVDAGVGRRAAGGLCSLHPLHSFPGVVITLCQEGTEAPSLGTDTPSGICGAPWWSQSCG